MKKTEIEKILPQRDPFLMVSEVDVRVPGKEGTGYKKLTGDEYFFEGHFPDKPVMPGVLIVEAIYQTALVVLGDGSALLSGVKNVKFRQTIEPQDAIEINVKLSGKEDGRYRFHGEVHVEGNIAASGEMLLSKGR